MCGTPLYYSPEVVKGVSYDNKIDTWAIGILTYELIIGKIPFKIWSELELSRICDDEIEFPDWVEISPKAKDFIFKILQKDPSDRISISKLLVHPFLAGVNVNHYYAL
jgi:serine/threonine protein kinase